MTCVISYWFAFFSLSQLCVCNLQQILLNIINHIFLDYNRNPLIIFLVTWRFGFYENNLILVFPLNA